MANTQAQEVYNAFEATFSDKKEIPESLELQWLKMSVGRYNAEIAIDEPLNFDEELLEFDKQIDQYISKIILCIFRNSIIFVTRSNIGARAIQIPFFHKTIPPTLKPLASDCQSYHSF